MTVVSPPTTDSAASNRGNKAELNGNLNSLTLSTTARTGGELSYNDR